VKTKLILIGGGGHCKSCIDIIEQSCKYSIVGILDKKEKIGDKVLGYEIIDTDENIIDYIQKDYEFLITIGQLRTPSIRKKIYINLSTNGAKIASIVSPRSYVSKHATIGTGSIIMHDALVNAGAKVGNNCIINTKALIEHDAIINDHCHISTSAIINGGVEIKQGTFFGSNATSKQYEKSARNDFIKAGALFIGTTNE